MSVRIVNDGPSALVVNVWETLTPASFGQNVERFDLAPGETSPAIEVRSWSRGVTVLEAIPAEGKPPPAADRTQRTLTDGSPVTRDALEINPTTGQQRGYVVLSEAERGKGFVRPVRRTYVHTKCGAATTMGTALAETYARDPKFYTGTFCVGCREHFPVGEGGEFVWDDGTKVGT